ncbi:DUF4365 domain-containing protein [Dawidia soli]|uniref:DUF4365 domain-containing protein n=1 Tax=Dawidia soli TaxID=2782352 RepID=A0AAP2GGI7_9BACT|nr:DUF4365 domain-containing protein [Dawidia soli]MBT1690652.1 DUF4365 domain-containing protein [Dawidia soli]
MPDEIKPAPYSSTSTPEARSKKILEYHLDDYFVKGETKIDDKVPNVDGVLELVDEGRYPIGKFQVQVKTIQLGPTGIAKHQCEKSFLAYCRTANLPVFLIVVDHATQSVFWLHVNRKVADTFLQKLKGETISVPFPPENVIALNNPTYLTQWRTIIESHGRAVHQADEYADRLATLELLESKLHTPANLPQAILKSVYRFVDELNFVWDRLFPAVKAAHYLDFWKIGIGVVTLNHEYARFILYPVRLNTVQTLVKTLSAEEFAVYDDEFSKWSFSNWLMTATTSPDNLLTRYKSYALHLVEDDVIKTIDQTDFKVDDEFLAHEYLIDFIDTHSEYLAITRHSAAYDLASLEYRLRYVFPMLEGHAQGWAENVRESTRDVGQYINMSEANWQKAIEAAEQQVRDEIVAPVEVVMTASDFDMDLIYYFIDLLRATGKPMAVRQYKIWTPRLKNRDPRDWTLEEKQTLLANYQLHRENFSRIYAKYLQEHFPLLMHDLALSPNEAGPFLATFSFSKNEWSYVACHYYLRGESPGQAMSFYHMAGVQELNDVPHPIKVNTTLSLMGEQYAVRGYKVHHLKYILAPAPTYELIRRTVLGKLKDYFKKHATW